MSVCNSNGLTYTECQVEQSHPDVESEEQDDVGHFAEEDDVSHMLLHRYWEKSKHISSDQEYKRRYWIRAQRQCW